MAKLSVCIVDNENGLKYHLGEVEVQREGTISTFSSTFQLTPEHFQVLLTEVTNKFDNRSLFDETDSRTRKAKKPKKSTRKG